MVSWSSPYIHPKRKKFPRSQSKVLRKTICGFLNVWSYLSFFVSSSCDHENGQDDDYIQTEELAAQLDKDLPGGSPAITSWPKYGELLSDQTSERRCFDDGEVGDQLATADVLFVLR